MDQFEQFINEVEVSIVDSVDNLSDTTVNLLYAGVLDAEQRLDALRDALSLLVAAEA
jgi:hypothetical protein